MGLDMYLVKQSKVKGVSSKQMRHFIEYCDWKKLRKEKRTSCSLKEWGDVEPSSLPQGYKRRLLLKMYKQNKLSVEEVAYWRKANQIHKWFVDNIQNGEDDCDWYEVTKEELKELLEICKKVKANSTLILRPGEEEYLIQDPAIAQALLPTQGGFFFGDINYNQFYIDNIKYTIDQIEEILKNTNFEEETIVYTSSW